MGKKLVKTIDPPFDVSFENITPDVAREMLERNRSDNRHITRSHVERYIAELNDEAWYITHQGLAFDTSGNLMDGQHRLTAIVESGISAPMMVCRGVGRELFTALDSGVPRRANQFLTGSYRIERAAMARTLMSLEASRGVAEIATISSGKFSSRAILGWIDEHPDVDEYGQTYAKTAVQVGRKFVSTTASALLTAGYLVGSHKWTSWWEDASALAHGSGVEMDNPLRVLFNVSPLTGGAGNTRILVMRALRTAKAYRDGEKIGVLRGNMYKTVKFW